MPRVRDVLHRFRPSGAPGAATAAGVPVDRAGELAVELEPVFALLAETEHVCADILERAGVEGAAIRARDADRARSVLAAGRALVESERAAAAARSRGTGVGREGAVSEKGRGGPAGPRGPVDDAISHHVDLVVGAVRSLLVGGTRTDDPLAGA
ncbi:MAG TPA: hypothetical protein VLQ78_00210 [Ornithinibacter sp.]|nr:hypothetical protein [Ornithinibacter sp.]